MLNTLSGKANYIVIKSLSGENHPELGEAMENLQLVKHTTPMDERLIKTLLLNYMISTQIKWRHSMPISPVNWDEMQSYEKRMEDEIEVEFRADVDCKTDSFPKGSVVYDVGGDTFGIVTE